MRTFLVILAVLISFGVTAHVRANPPYDLRVDDVGTASTGGLIATYELWENCTTTPNLVDGDVQSPETYVGLLATDGTYNFCIRGRNLSGLGPVGETVDITVAALEAPGPIDGGDTIIVIECPNGACTTVITIN